MQNDVTPFGLARIKREGDIVDPDDMIWEHNPFDDSCAVCRDRYANWLIKYNEQEENKEVY